jgi:threonine dehydratase
VSELAINVDDIHQASERIRGQVRRTPCLRARFFREPPGGEYLSLTLKLECLQVSGSFKARGASNKAAMLNDKQLARGLITASGGNHGLGVAYAGWRYGAPVQVVLPIGTSEAKVDALRRWGASVQLAGTVWDEANAQALNTAERDGLTYVHPFADPVGIAGQGTVGLEVLKQCKDVDTILVAIGGGGLIGGIATAIKSLKPSAKVIGIEPVGAPTLSRSVAAGELVTLERIETVAASLSPLRSDEKNLAIVRAHVDDIVLVSDDEMREAARSIWFEMGLSVELSAAAAFAALQTGRYQPERDENVCVIVCGAGEDGAKLAM